MLRLCPRCCRRRWPLAACRLPARLAASLGAGSRVAGAPPPRRGGGAFPPAGPRGCARLLSRPRRGAALPPAACRCRRAVRRFRRRLHSPAASRRPRQSSPSARRRAAQRRPLRTVAGSREDWGFGDARIGMDGCPVGDWISGRVGQNFFQWAGRLGQNGNNDLRGGRGLSFLYIFGPNHEFLFLQPPHPIKNFSGVLGGSPLSRER